MFTRYREILALPGASSFFWWGLLARVQMGLGGLGTFLLVQIEYDSYAKAGAVLGVASIGFAALSPTVSRLVDDYGQARVLRIGFAISAAARTAFVVAALMHAPIWVLLALGPLFAATGSQSTLTRARWTHLVPNRHALNTAFSLESSLEEVLFIAGPALATVLATQVASWLPVALVILTLTIGGYRFLSFTETEPPARKGRRVPSADATSAPADVAAPVGASAVTTTPDTTPRRFGNPLRGHLLATTPALVITAIIFATQGALFASVDASTVRLAEELGQKAWAGPVLAVWALGSLVGGLAYGAMVWHGSLASRLLWGVSFTGIGAATFALAPNLSVLAVFMFLTGMVIAPTMAVGDGVVHALLPRARVTEGMAWTRVGMDGGVALGAWLAGVLIERHGSQGGFAVTTAAGLTGLVLVASAWRYLRRKRAYEEEVSRDVADEKMAQ